MVVISAKWTRLVSSARLQRSSHCAATLGSRLWIFGGELLPRQPVDDQLDVVDLDASDAVSATTLPTPAEAPTPRVGAAIATLGDDLYLFSGRGGLAMAPVEEHGALWRYRTAESRWTLVRPADPIAPYPAGRSYHAAAADGRGRSIYVHAGCPEQGRLSDLWRFDTDAAVWTQLAPAPLPARGGASIAFVPSNGKLYRVNGFDGAREQGGGVDVYDPETDAWSTVAYRPDDVDGPGPRSVGALVAVRDEAGGRDYLVSLFGERDPSSLGHAGAGAMLADVWAFDVQREAWAKVEIEGSREAPAARGWFDADVVRDSGDGKPAIVVHGGLAEDNTRLGDVWKLQIG